MYVWIVQWYVKVPVAAKVWLNDFPALIVAEASSLPESEVTVCGASDPFVHVTVPPTFTNVVVGLKWYLSAASPMLTWADDAAPADPISVSNAATAPTATIPICRRRPILRSSSKLRAPYLDEYVAVTWKGFGPARPPTGSCIIVRPRLA
jgi:hypothetical protein